MEYKELIAISKKAADEWRNDHAFYQAGTLIDSLCSALETMQAERDAAVNDLALCKSCATCKYNGGAIKQPCFMCGTIMPSKGQTRWEWRGQKTK